VPFSFIKKNFALFYQKIQLDVIHKLYALLHMPAHHKSTIVDFIDIIQAAFDEQLLRQYSFAKKFKAKL